MQWIARSSEATDPALPTECLSEKMEAEYVGSYRAREDRNMIDTSKGKRLVVSDDGAGGPYIKVPVNQLDEIRERLDRNGVDYWVDSMAISIDGRPARTVINLGLTGDAARVQAILDEVD